MTENPTAGRPCSGPCYGRWQPLFFRCYHAVPPLLFHNSKSRTNCLESNPKSPPKRQHNSGEKNSVE
jgi:hypothetical protein